MHVPVPVPARPTTTLLAGYWLVIIHMLHIDRSIRYSSSIASHRPQLAAAETERKTDRSGSGGPAAQCMHVVVGG